MVEEGVRAAHVPGVGHLLGREERPGPRPDPERPRLAEAGDEPLAFVEHLVDLALGHLELVGVGNARVRRPDHRDGPDRDDDVAVSWPLAAVDHRVHQPVVHRDHDPLAGQDGDLAAGELGDLPRPGPRRVDDDLRPYPNFFPGQLVLDERPDDPPVVAFEIEHAVVGEDLGPVLPRRSGAARDELPGVEARVGNGEGPRDRWVEAGLEA
jgi:hypothetical protein